LPHRRQPLLDRAGHRQHVLVLLHDGNAADHLARSVEVGRAAAEVVADLDVADILQLNRLAFLRARDHDGLQLVDVLARDDAAELVLAVGDLDGASSDLLKHALKRVDYLTERRAPIGEERWKELDLVLLLETANRRDLRDAGDALQRRLDLALVQQPELAKV